MYFPLELVVDTSEHGKCLHNVISYLKIKNLNVLKLTSSNILISHPSFNFKDLKILLFLLKFLISLIRYFLQTSTNELGEIVKCLNNNYDSNVIQFKIKLNIDTIVNARQPGSHFVIRTISKWRALIGCWFSTAILITASRVVKYWVPLKLSLLKKFIRRKKIVFTNWRFLDKNGGYWDLIE